MMDCFGNFKCRGGGGWVRTIFCGGVAKTNLGNVMPKYFRRLGNPKILWGWGGKIFWGVGWQKFLGVA